MREDQDIFNTVMEYPETREYISYIKKERLFDLEGEAFERSLTMHSLYLIEDGYGQAEIKDLIRFVVHNRERIENYAYKESN